MQDDHDVDEAIAPVSYKNELSISIRSSPMPQTASWKSLQEMLDNCMDVFTLRTAIDIVEELAKLEAYLQSEFNTNDKDLYFSSQKLIIEYINKTLKVQFSGFIRCSVIKNIRIFFK